MEQIPNELDEAVGANNNDTLSDPIGKEDEEKSEARTSSCE